MFRRSGRDNKISKTAKSRLNTISIFVKANRSGIGIDLVVAGTSFFVFPEIDLIMAQIIPDIKTSTQIKAITTAGNPTAVLSGKIVLLAKIKKSNKNTIIEQIIREEGRSLIQSQYSKIRVDNRLIPYRLQMLPFDELTRMLSILISCPKTNLL
jgi:hypothetical protein